MTRHGAPQQRLAIGTRIAAAIFAGYAITYLFTGALPLWLPIARTEAVLWSSLLSFALYTSIAIYAFAARSVVRLWCNLGLLTIILMIAIWWRR